MSANSELNFPHNKRSGTNRNSNIFIMAIMPICIRAFKRGHKLVRIQIPMQTSETPIRMVKSLACSSPKIVPTIN